MKDDYSLKKDRLSFIDATRGLMILFMLLDHVRETFLLHIQLSDPMNISTTILPLYIERILSHLCAPLFVFLAGVSAFLYSQKHSVDETRSFLFKRGLILVLMEITIINFAWTFQFPPVKVFLQVIWATGLSMIVLSFLLKVPSLLFIFITGGIIIFHNLLDSMSISESQPILHFFWAVIHQKEWIHIGDISMRTTYPILPWIGVISMGWLLGPIFVKQAQERSKYFLSIGLTGMTLFCILRFLNFYGDVPLGNYNSFSEYILNFFNLTKYPPSFLYLLFFLSLGLLVMLCIDKLKEDNKIKKTLALFGSVPMFFYITHLYLLKILYLIAVSVFGLNQGEYYGFESVSSMWLCAVLLILVMYYPIRWFAHFKHKRKDILWLKYF